MKQIARSMNKILMIGILLNVVSPMTLLASKSSKDHKKKFDYCADYVVIGIGGSGAVMARRLTDDFKTSVIGLEAGDNENNNPVVQDPSAAAFETTFLNFPQLFWQGETIPLDNVSFTPSILGTKVFDWTNGRLLGGGSAINGLQFERGTTNTWQRFQDELGPVWNVDTIFERYKELETFMGPQPIDPSRGTMGPWNNEALPMNPTDDANYILDGLVQITGFAPVPDHNAKDANPLGPFSQWDLQIMPQTRLRESTATAFLGPDVMTFDGKGVGGRKLRVLFESTALSLIWDECKKNKVVGVKFQRDGKCFTVKAKKEVIVCAGFQSAQFLQTNGIGPRDVLEEAGVKVRVENEHVGAHLTNHPSILGITFSTPNADFVPQGEEAFLYFVPGAFLPDPSQDPTIRGMQWIGLPVFSPDGNPANTVLIIVPLLLFPKSEGTVKIQNGDPLKIPLVDVNYLGDTEGPNGTSADLESLKASLRALIPQLNEYFLNNPTPSGGQWQLVNPDPSIFEPQNDAALTQFVKDFLSQAHHWANTVRMARTAEDGAVDPEGRVFGVKGLRVVDNSILLTQIDGNLLGSAILVGWTISERIIKEHKCKKKKSSKDHKDKKGKHPKKKGHCSTD